MTDSIILHHYEASPYAEKVRLLFGLSQLPWQSLLCPVQPPRPNLDPLTGGYRRIPVAQIGADIFCDTALIARELARASQNPALDPSQVPAEATALMELAEKKAFFAAIGAVKPLRLLGTMLLQFGPLGTYRFVKDRTGLLKGGTVRPAQGAKAQAVLDELLSTLEKRFSQQAWVGGDAASIADFAVYHPLWLHVSCNRRPLNCGPKTQDWYQRVGLIGHGPRQEIQSTQAFSAAREAEPRPLPSSVDNPPVALGSAVEVAPADYGIRAVQGRLAALTEDRIILARQTEDFGLLHVHFPREGYSLTATRA